MKLTVEKEKAYAIRSHYSDFAGDVQKWKSAFYELYRYQMTYDFAYELYVSENRNSGVFVHITVKEAFKQNILDTMKDLGYRNVTIQDCSVGLVDAFSCDDDVECLVLDY